MGGDIVWRIIMAIQNHEGITLDYDELLVLQDLINRETLYIDELHGEIAEFSRENWQLRQTVGLLEFIEDEGEDYE